MGICALRALRGLGHASGKVSWSTTQSRMAIKIAFQGTKPLSPAQTQVVAYASLAATEWCVPPWSLIMINGEHRCASTSPSPEPVSDDHSSATACQWLSRTTKYTVNRVNDSFRNIPNPVDFLLAVPGFILDLSGRNLSCATSSETRTWTPAAESGPFLVSPEPARITGLNKSQHHPRDETISRQSLSEMMVAAQQSQCFQ